jgi:tRNA pseudouridine32 synthase/23S rRNA pseudouridine746 synthase
MTIQPIEKHLTLATDLDSVLELLAVETGLSKQKLKSAMQKGCVWWERGKQVQQLRRATKSLKKGDILHLYYDEEILATPPPAAKLIADEGDYSIWHKPYGMYSQGTKWGDHCTITRYAEQHLTPQRPAFTVHRLDRAANGLIIVAHKKTVAAAFSQLFKTHQLQKHYRAVVYGEWDLSQPELLIDSPIDEKPARSFVSGLDFDEKMQQSTLKIRIESGRKHQIRRHLSERGFPIVGDRLYGDKPQTQDLQLTAYYLAFVCPMTGVEKEYCLAASKIENLIDEDLENND